VAGYRVGMIVGGGALLIFHDRLGWPRTFLAMAALTALATVPIAAAREPGPMPPAADRSRGRHFFRRPGAARLLLLLGTYKAGDAFATGMLRPFLADAGLTLAGHRLAARDGRLRRGPPRRAGGRAAGESDRPEIIPLRVRAVAGGPRSPGTRT
jgi:hypothetical protein